MAVVPTSHVKELTKDCKRLSKVAAFRATANLVTGDLLVLQEYMPESVPFWKQDVINSLESACNNLQGTLMSLRESDIEDFLRSSDPTWVEDTITKFCMIRHDILSASKAMNLRVNVNSNEIQFLTMKADLENLLDKARATEQKITITYLDGFMRLFSRNWLAAQQISRSSGFDVELLNKAFDAVFHAAGRVYAFPIHAVLVTRWLKQCQEQILNEMGKLTAKTLQKRRDNIDRLISELYAVRDKLQNFWKEQWAQYLRSNYEEAVAMVQSASDMDSLYNRIQDLRLPSLSISKLVPPQQAVGFDLRHLQKLAEPELESLVTQISTDCQFTGGFSMNDLNESLDDMEALRKLLGPLLLQQNHFQEVKKNNAANKGRNGYVKQYRHIDTGELVAIKSLDLDNYRDYAAREMFILTNMLHENIVGLKGFIIDKGKLSIVMEFLPGGTFFTALKTMSTRERMQSLFRVTKCLAFFHANGIIHRDIKPENVMFRKDGCPILIDFDVSVVLENETTPSEDWGTRGYMAPEVINCENYTEKIDIFSLSILFWSAIPGVKPPWYDNNFKKYQISSYTLGGNRPAIPQETPTPLRELLCNMWNEEAGCRPTALEILKYMIDKTVCFDPADMDAMKMFYKDEKECLDSTSIYTVAGRNM